MSTDSLDTPEARQHKRDTEILLGKLNDYLTNESVEMPEENNGDPVLRVLPTRHNDGRVRLTIAQLAALMGLSVEELLDPEFDLADMDS